MADSASSTNALEADIREDCDELADGRSGRSAFLSDIKPMVNFFDIRFDSTRSPKYWPSPKLKPVAISCQTYKANRPRPSGPKPSTRTPVRRPYTIWAKKIKDQR